MNEYTFNLKISELKKGQQEIKEKLEQMIADFKPADNLWDNADMMQRLKISKRTLADWRNEGIVDYVKIKGKIYYSQQAIKSLIMSHSVVQQNEKNVK